MELEFVLVLVMVMVQCAIGSEQHVCKPIIVFSLVSSSS